MKRDDRSTYIVLGGQLDFLLERLTGWTVDVTRTDGTEVSVVVERAWGEAIEGHLYDPETAGPSDTAVTIPWSDVDVVDVN
jgi:hypothetical protein